MNEIPSEGKSRIVEITQEIAELLCKCYVKYYVRSPHKMNMQQAYRLTLSTFFTSSYEDRNGAKVPVILIENCPSFSQFRYWGQKLANGEVNEAHTRKALVGERNAKQDHK